VKNAGNLLQETFSKFCCTVFTLAHAVFRHAVQGFTRIEVLDLFRTSLEKSNG
jgi:hypothetical protein